MLTNGATPNKRMFAEAGEFRKLLGCAFPCAFPLYSSLYFVPRNLYCIIVRYLQKWETALNSIVWWYNTSYLTRTFSAKRYHTGDVNDEGPPVCTLSSSRTERSGIAPSESVTDVGGACGSSMIAVFARIARFTDGGWRVVTIIK